MAEIKVPLEKIDGGCCYRAREAVTGEHYIEVHRTRFNWWIVRNRKNGSGWDRAFCYSERGSRTLTAAILAAIEWDGTDDTEPVGYDRRICLQAGEQRLGDHLVVRVGGYRYRGKASDSDKLIRCHVQPELRGQDNPDVQHQRDTVRIRLHSRPESG